MKARVRSIGVDQVVNATPHPLHFYSDKNVVFNDKIRKHILEEPREKPVLVIPPSGVVLSVRFRIKKYSKTLQGIPIIKRKVREVDVPPPEWEDKLIIVSSSFARACEQQGVSWLDRLLVVTSPVYKQNGYGLMPVGCLHLGRVK